MSQEDMVAMGELTKADWYTPKGSYMPDNPPWTENKDKRWRQLMGLEPGGTGAVPSGEKRPPEAYNNVGHGWVDSKADGFKLPAPAGPYDPTKPDSALRRAEAKFDEDQLMDKVAKHCDSISARLDACEEKMVARTGGRDK